MISVCIRAYNSEKYIDNAIESIINQDYSGPIEILICYDEGTCDDTLRIVEKARILGNRSLVIHKHQHTTPFRALEKCCLQFFKGDFLTFLDYDNVMPKSYIRAVVEDAEERDYSFLFTKTILIDSDGSILNRQLTQIPEDPYVIMNLIYSNFIDINVTFLRRDCVHLIKRKLAFLKATYFDWIHEDWLIALLALKHCKPYYVKETHVLYRIHDQNLTASFKKNSIKELFNIERALRTLLGFYLIEEHSLSHSEIRALQTSVINHYTAWIYRLSELNRSLWKIKIHSTLLRVLKKALGTLP